MLFTPGHPVRIFCLTLLVSLVGTVSVQGVQAQSALEPGCILTSSGDTTRGVIDNWRWQRAPEQVQFAKSKTASLETLDVSDIAGFGVGSYAFVRRVVDVDRRPAELNKRYHSDAATQRDTLFLQRLVDGPMTLYRSFTNRPHYFVETEEAELTELTYYLRPVGRAGSERMQASNYYQEQLRVRRTDACADEPVSRVEYTRNDLVAFAASCAPDGEAARVSTSSRDYRVTHVLSLRGSRTASRHSTGFGTGSMTGISPGVQYQLLLEMGERNPAGGLLVGVGIQRMNASAPSEAVTTPAGQGGVTVGELTATVLDVSTELRVRLTDADWRPFFGMEAAFMFPLAYEATYGVALNRNRAFSVGSGAQDWNTMQLGAGGGIGIEGPTFGGRLGLLYGFPVQRADGGAPRQVDTELQLFLKF